MKAVRRWFRDITYNPPIRFLLDCPLYLPWGLMYDAAPPSQAPDNTRDHACDAARYEGFWCLKYGVSATYHRINPAVRASWDASALGFMAVVNSDTYEAAQATVRKSDPEGARAIDAIMSYAGTPITTTGELVSRWRGWQEGNVLLYFYCHSSGDTLALSRHETIDVLEWDQHLGPAEEGDGPVGLVVLNGCFTAAGGDYGGFLEATAGDNFCGLIGTEARVPALFALRFGAELVRRMLSTGNSVEGVLTDMRRTHWPLSILYSVNCPGDIELASEASGLVAVGGGNYSRLEVGGRVLFRDTGGRRGGRGG